MCQVIKSQSQLSSTASLQLLKKNKKTIPTIAAHHLLHPKTTAEESQDSSIQPA